MPRTAFRIPYRTTWWLVFALMATPLVWLIVQAFTGGLGANPIEAINRFLGDWALRMLLVVLAATPLKILFGWVWPVRLRRMLGLWSFVYVFLHITNYVAIDQFFAWGDIWQDILKRKFITVGMVAFVILTALAATSWNGAIRRMGARSWKKLHKLVYAAAVLGCLHYVWMVKADLREPLIHLGVLGVLLTVRVYHQATR
ncbi:sulfite oxidase heme-binding subunit YedZ [Magnetovibrio sp. PR-2]|uniref:sulfite oxidase heme-binding subunit YedZ n=1 Tax=Magnetovibrio sp. PR-2 TaxID=3120356 RepID=UPI003FA53198